MCFEEATQKGISDFNLLLEYGLFLLKRGVSYTSHTSESSDENKFLQLLKFVHYEGKQLVSDLDTI